MDKDELLRRYLEGELTDDGEREALHVIADDPEMRSMLRFEQMLSETLSQNDLSYGEEKVPAGFSDKVMHHIEQKEQGREEVSYVDKVRNWFQQLWVPKQIQWRPAYAFVLALLVLVSFSYPLFLTNNQKARQQISQDNNQPKLGSSIQQISTRPNKVLLRFVYIDGDAKSVAVAGDFSNWNKISLSKQTIHGQQVWTGLVSMSRGEHNYMFVKNGKEWVTDPLAPVQRDDGFGNKNAVIYI